MSAAATDDPYAEVHALLRDIRERVADDVHDYVVERQEVGSQGELAETVRRVGAVAQKIVQAQARQLQAREHGLPLARAVAEEREARDLLRATVMNLAGAAAAWVVDMDFQARKGELDS